MEYFSDVLDRSTGELVSVSIGDYVTITELGDLYRFGKREVRSVLRHLGVLQVEGAHGRHRLSAWVVDRGWGKRIEKRGKPPFDVVGPELRSWVAERWDAAVEELDRAATGPASEAAAALLRFQTERSMTLTIPQSVSWLADYWPDLSQEDVAVILNVTRQLVSKYQRIRSARRAELVRLRHTDPDEVAALYKANRSEERVEKN